MAIMLLLGTSSAWGGVQFTNDYIFLDLSSSVSEWEKDGAVFQVALNEWDHCGNGWNGANETGHLSKKYDLIETSEGSHIYYANVSDDNKSRYGAYFYRCNPSDKSVWNTACIGYNNSSHNCFKVNGWTSSTSTYNLTDVYCISAPTFGEVEVGQSATSSGTYLYAGVSTIPEISNNSTEFQYVAGSSSITTNGSSTITVKFTPSSAGDKTGTLKFGSYLTTSLSGKGKVSCIPSATLSSAVYDAENNEIDLSGSIAPCGNELFYGFLWKNKNDANWNTANAISGTGGNNNKTTEDIDFNQSWDGFTPGDTYEFTAYALDATTNPYTWYYSTDENNVIEVSTCTSIPDNTYAIAGNNVWTGNANPVTINYDANTYGTPTILYDGEAQIPTDVGTYAITINVPAHNGYCASTISLGDYEITCIDVEKPAITTSATVCEGTKVTLSSYNGDNTNTVKWYSSQEFNSEVTEQVTLTDDGTKYYAKAYHEASGCYSSEYSTLTFTVNPLPNISISGNNSPVLYEDVTLTATGSDIDEVNWTITSGPGTLSNTTGTSVKLTSSTAGTVKVKATATSENDCTKESNELSVVFGAENCAPVASNDIEITFTHPADIQTKGQWWGMGTMYYSTNNTSWSSKKMHEDCATSGSVTFTLTDVATSTIYVYFEACYDWGYGGDNTKKATTVNDIITLNRGKKYSITITNGDINATATATVTGSLTQDPEITAPAVKMISAEYDEEKDVIVAKGAVYKTGCGETFWGFQYSTDGQTWGTADADFIRPSTGNSLSVPGEFDYSFPIPDAGGGDIYYIRAYALNNYNNDDYNLSSAVYSTTFLPVEIPSKTINSATISLVDSDGDPSDDTEVCPQSTVYLKVSYEGGDFKDYEAADNFPGTDLELVTHDKTNNYAIFSFTATAAGTANITISNTSGSTVTPADGVSITLKDVQVVTPPIITINPESAMICQGDDATISIVEENQNFTYTIYKDGEALNPQSFTITEAGVYTIGATENECNTSATSMPIELKVVSSDVKIGLEADNTAIGPWQPLKLTVTPAKGYEYTLEGLNGMVYTKEGDVYTIKIPRPNDWSFGNSGTQQNLEKEDKVFTAKIKVSDEVSCGSKEVTVTLTDTEENCE